MNLDQQVRSSKYSLCIRLPADFVTVTRNLNWIRHWVAFFCSARIWWFHENEDEIGWVKLGCWLLHELFETNPLAENQCLNHFALGGLILFSLDSFSVFVVLTFETFGKYGYSGFVWTGCSLFEGSCVSLCNGPPSTVSPLEYARSCCSESQILLCAASSPETCVCSGQKSSCLTYFSGWLDSSQRLVMYRANFAVNEPSWANNNISILSCNPKSRQG